MNGNIVAGIVKAAGPAQNLVHLDFIGLLVVLLHTLLRYLIDDLPVRMRFCVLPAGQSLHWDVIVIHLTNRRHPVKANDFFHSFSSFTSWGASASSACVNQPSEARPLVRVQLSSPYPAGIQDQRLPVFSAISATVVRHKPDILHSTGFQIQINDISSVLFRFLRG